MIDTDKYEGHTPAPWKTGGYDIQAIKVWTVDGFDKDDNWIHAPRADRTLAVDAPLLLAEVKRLREEFTSANSAASNLGKYAGKLSAEVERLREQLKEANDVIQYALEMSSDDDSTSVFEDYLEVIQ